MQPQSPLGTLTGSLFKEYKINFYLKKVNTFEKKSDTAA